MSRFRRFRARRRTGVRAGLVAVIVGVLTGGYFVVSALAAPTIPAPTITGSPTNPTSSTTASFTYTDSQPGVSFRCSLDGSGFSFCPPSGVTYAGLTSRGHTFAVEAVQGVSTSLATTYTWRIDTAGPTITMTFPADHGSYGAATWAAGCPTPGICGTAADASSVQSVAVSIYQESSHQYWTGSSLSSYSPVFNPASGTTSWHYGFTPPQAGTYTVQIQATDNLGNASTAGARFRYQSVTPPAPTITKKPSNPSTDSSPEFQFTDAWWPRISFWCSLDGGAVQPCTGDTDHDGDRHVEGELQLHDLSAGPHCFSVYVMDEAGNDSPPTTYCWTLTSPARTFTVGGDLTTPLAPGVSESLDMTFTNPFSNPITIAAGAVTSANIAITPNQAGCAASNFEVSQALTATVTIPAHQATPLSLATLGVPQADWPVITMIDTNSNQDACQDATLTLTYSGIEATE